MVVILCPCITTDLVFAPYTTGRGIQSFRQNGSKLRMPRGFSYDRTQNDPIEDASTKDLGYHESSACFPRSYRVSFA